MRRIGAPRPILLLTAICWLAIRTVCPAQQVVAVLSSELTPYEEAFQGLQESQADTVARICLTDGDPQIGRETRVVVAFGGQAAARTYPDRVTAVICLAPGIQVDIDNHRSRQIEIPMLPAPAAVLANLRKIQPQLKRLAVLSMAEVNATDLRHQHQAATDAGIELQAVRLERQDSLPDYLRGLLDQQVDALWLPPDPLLINARNMLVLKEFCWSNDIPFYVPSASLVQQGAVGSVAISFRDIGRTAGEVVRQLLAGQHPPRRVYPQRAQVVVNRTAAARSGLELPQSITDHVDAVLP
jgi:hypothetical protein